MRKNLTTLATLIMLLGAGCPTVDVPEPVSEAPDRGAPTSAPVSNRLDLSGQGLMALPKSVMDRTDLQELDISDNRIGGALPAEIGRLDGLRFLDASGNLMTGLPAEVGRLQELRVLDLSDNRLTGLPHELANLQKLVTLNLRGNDISAYDLDIIRTGIPNAEILHD